VPSDPTSPSGICGKAQLELKQFALVARSVAD
jgi:hypothetical protein